MDANGVARGIGRFLAGDNNAEHTAALVSTSSVGTSFMPGLLPRSGIDQAIATGIVAATQYGLVVTSQAGYAAIARRIAGDDGSPAGRVRGAATQAAVGLGVVALGSLIERALPPRAGEPVRRALVRTAGRRGRRIGFAGVLVAGIATADAAVGSQNRAVRLLSSGAGLIVGGALAAVEIRKFRADDPTETARLTPAVDPIVSADRSAPPDQAFNLPPLARSLALGGAVSAGLQVIAFAEGAFARGVAAGVRRIAPGAGPLAPLIGHGVMLGTTAGSVFAAIEYANRTAESGGAAIDAAYSTAPTSANVSGGPNSLIDWSTLSREGVRFVNMALTVEEIVDVCGGSAEVAKPPVRAFVGLASAATVDARVDLVMRDLEELGAFDRKVICIASPTGSGYVNYVAIESLEYLTQGDCATVSMQYSLRPSFLSLDRVAMGREQNRALFQALSWRLRSIPEESRPRLVGFGESLGAHTMQDAFLHEGVRGLHRVGLDRALFLGTPAGSKWAKEWRLDPARTDPDGTCVEVASHEEWLVRSADERAAQRYVLLSHHEDPIVHFEPALAVQEPRWLVDTTERPKQISRHARWYPLTTFVLTLVDVKNAMSVVPGTFVARGHDYRADLARMISAAYALPVDDEMLHRMEVALRKREANWAERRLIAEQLQRAKEAVQRQVDSWGLGSPLAVSPA